MIKFLVLEEEVPPPVGAGWLESHLCDQLTIAFYDSRVCFLRIFLEYCQGLLCALQDSANVGQPDSVRVEAVGVNRHAKIIFLQIRAQIGWCRVDKFHRRNYPPDQIAQVKIPQQIKQLGLWAVFFPSGNDKLHKKAPLFVTWTNYNIVFFRPYMAESGQLHLINAQTTPEPVISMRWPSWAIYHITDAYIPWAFVRTTFSFPQEESRLRGFLQRCDYPNGK